jgi:hypothetical protein
MDMYMLTLFDGMRCHTNPYAVFDNRLTNGDRPYAYLVPKRHLVCDSHTIAKTGEPGILINERCHIVSRIQHQKPPAKPRF